MTNETTTTTDEPKAEPANNGNGNGKADTGIVPVWNASTEELTALRSALVDRDVTDVEFRFFLAAARHLNLDPFKRQVYLVKYGGKPVLQTGIDGYRAQAIRTRKFAGQDEPIWIDKVTLGAKPRDVAPADGTAPEIKLVPYGPSQLGREVWPFGPEHPPFAAIARIWRTDITRAFTYVALYSSYVRRTREGAPMNLWATMPETMLFKCALAQCLRAGFPDELGGVYTVEEMEQAANESRAAASPKGVNPEQHAMILDAIKRAEDVDKARLIEWLKSRGYTGEKEPALIKGKPVSDGLRVLNDFAKNALRRDEIDSVVIILKGGEAILEGEFSASFDSEVKV